jgi:hypothetical protein
MTSKKHPRLLLPLIAVLAGTLVACAVGLRQGWGTSLGTEAVVLAWASGLYFWGGSDSDTGSVIGQRADERQRLVWLRAARLSLTVTIAALVSSCLIAAAANYAIWPFEVLLAIISIAYLIGLRAYGVDPDDVKVGKYSFLGFREDPLPDEPLARHSQDDPVDLA